MLITAYFTKFGVPQSGIVPTTKITKISDSSIIINEDSMTEIADGFYKYEFTTYEDNEEYIIRCNGGSGIPEEERYTYTSWGTDSILKSDGFVI